MARRCLPAIQAKKGVIMVGNETTYDDGLGNRRNVTELLEGARWVPVAAGAAPRLLRYHRFGGSKPWGFCLQCRRQRGH